MEEEIINFPSEDITEAVNEWDLALVGYSLGKRPYYEALLNSVKKLWNLKGSLKLISLSEGFFLFKFSNAEDYDLVWSRGAWFIFGKPFIFQKWNPHFSHSNAEDCVQVDAKATFPETIPICVEGKLFNLKIQYEWRPTFCEFCGSLNHSPSKCSANPNPEINNIPNPPRGRSTSRRPRPHSLNPKGLLPIPNSSTKNNVMVDDSAEHREAIPVNTDHDLTHFSACAPTEVSNQMDLPSSSALHYKDVNISTKEGADLNTEKFNNNKSIENCPMTDNIVPIAILAGASTNIPNLNSSTSLTSSTSAPNKFNSDGKKQNRVTYANKFSVLQDDNEDDSSSSLHNEGMEETKGYSGKNKKENLAWNIRGFNNPDKVFCCRNLVKEHMLDLICILENRILSSNLQDPWFCSTHKVFENELSFNNFDLATPGRIWIKWNSDNISFNPISSSPQMITGNLMMGSQIIMLLSAVYASNSFDERNKLWAELGEVNPHGALPWAVIGDFNTCRLQSEKKGGNLITMDRLYPFNSFIFDNNLVDLPSTGYFHTWFNQRQDNPIHLKLDRVLVNETWINQFPNSHYNVLSSHVSDHTPLILRDVPTMKNPKRFMYKNYWSHIPDFWSILLNIFQLPDHGNPILSLYKKLKLLKREIKTRNWNSSNHIANKCASLVASQEMCQKMIDNDPLNKELCGDLNRINANINYYNSLHASWTIQRSKIKWLKHGEEDLKFLYSKIRKRKLLMGVLSMLL
ncbi:uncharacterized protein LOC110116623 [Dendrobium catenatum]|uniref:uncharacterized protein LOC110116623 n=1 Tax=Dendrobium catenatum TaxID=906689 RepID=UPI0009F1E404|nr:uncharacterized protein LOC110116623 [Dendrobium catenatum]